MPEGHDRWSHIFRWISDETVERPPDDAVSPNGQGDHDLANWLFLDLLRAEETDAAGDLRKDGTEKSEPA